MIHKSQARPPQFGFIYLGKGYYLDVDPIGGVKSMLETQWIKLQSFFGKNHGGYPHEIWHRWDSFYRCKLKIQSFFDRCETRRFTGK